MKYIILTAILLSGTSYAQSPQPNPIHRPQVSPSQPPADALPDNYQVTLSITDKDGQPLEVSVVVASTRFQTSLGEQDLTFSGTVTIEDSGSIVIAYALGWQTAIPAGTNNVQFKSSASHGSVRLKPGEEVQIIRAGPRVARLAISKLESTKPK